MFRNESCTSRHHSLHYLILQFGVIGFQLKLQIKFGVDGLFFLKKLWMPWATLKGLVGHGLRTTDIGME